MSHFFYKVNDKEYPVRIIHKPIKNIHYRYVDGEFVVSCSTFVSQKNILKGLDRYALYLLKRNDKTPPIGEDYIYLYGQKMPLSYPGVIKFSNGEEIRFQNKEELLKILKKSYLGFIKERVKYYSSLMSVPEYKVSVRDMKTRYGSNSKKTKSLHFATSLMHYDTSIIDSVVVHELAHILVYNHSSQFYEVVYKYSPNYDMLRKKLIRGEFQ